MFLITTVKTIRQKGRKKKSRKKIKINKEMEVPTSKSTKHIQVHLNKLECREKFHFFL